MLVFFSNPFCKYRYNDVSIIGGYAYSVTMIDPRSIRRNHEDLDNLHRRMCSRLPNVVIVVSKSYMQKHNINCKK